MTWYTVSKVVKDTVEFLSNKAWKIIWQANFGHESQQVLNQSEEQWGEWNWPDRLELIQTIWMANTPSQFGNANEQRYDKQTRKQIIQTAYEYPKFEPTAMDW